MSWDDIFRKRDEEAAALPEHKGSSLDEDPSAVALREGHIMRLPGDNELFLDLDSADGETMMEEGLEILNRNWRQRMPSGETPFTVTYNKPSKSGVNRHVIVSCPFTLDPIKRIALQACLGSDLVREILSLLRVLLELPRPPTVFFERPALIRLVKNRHYAPNSYLVCRILNPHEAPELYEYDEYSETDTRLIQGDMEWAALAEAFGYDDRNDSMAAAGLPSPEVLAFLERCVEEGTTVTDTRYFVEGN